MNFPAIAMSRDDDVRESFEALWGLKLDDEPGLRIPNMIDEAIEGNFKGLFVQGRGHRPVRPQHPAHHRGPCRRWNA